MEGSFCSFISKGSSRPPGFAYEELPVWTHKALLPPDCLISYGASSPSVYLAWVLFCFILFYFILFIANISCRWKCSLLVYALGVFVERARIRVQPSSHQTLHNPTCAGLLPNPRLCPSQLLWSAPLLTPSIKFLQLEPMMIFPMYFHCQSSLRSCWLEKALEVTSSSLHPDLPSPCALRSIPTQPCCNSMIL